MKYKNYFYFFFIFIILIFPFVHSNLDYYSSIPEVKQEGNPFYEINPCKISLYDFIKSNTKSIYQDHYYFRPTDNSSIGCFGKIAGVTILEKNLETQFFISIGTNSFINLIYQSSLWFLILRLIPKHKNKQWRNNKFHLFALFLSAYLLTFSIYAENRFYDSSFYFFDYFNLKSYLLPFLSFFYITKVLVEGYFERNDRIINFIPLIFLIPAIFSGFNLTIYAVLFLYLGINKFLVEKKLGSLNKIYIILSLWWLFNSHGSYFFKVGKLRGFSSSVYEFNANLYWIIFFFLLLNGLVRFFQETKDNFDLKSFVQNVSFVCISILSIGLVGSNFPLFNFLSYYFLGLQRYVVELTNPFAIDEYLVRISWRGIAPSSETIGEFFAIGLIFMLFNIVRSNKTSILEVIGILSASLGLYFSDNRTSIVLVFIFSIYYLKEGLKFKVANNLNYKKYFIFLFFIAIILFTSTENFQNFYNYSSKALLDKSNNVNLLSNRSSFLTLLNSAFENQTLFSNFFGLFSSISLLLNRSEMWGLYFSRYNPTFLELLIGSGPLSFGQFYGEILLDNVNELLLPHSSLLSLLIFFGVLPTTGLIIYLCFKLIEKNNIELKIFIIFVVINILKNDSLNYFNSFIFYFLCFLILRDKKNLEKYQI